MLNNGIHIGRRGGVRLTGGGEETEWTPAQLSTLAAWYDASDATQLFDATSGGSLVAADGTVARIEDKSGNAFHLTQAAAGARPTRKTAVRNGLDVLRGDGWDYLFRGTTNILRNVAGATLAAVVAPKDAANEFGMLYVSTSNANITRAHITVNTANALRSGGRRLDTDSFAGGNGGSYTADEWMVLIARFDYAAATLKLYKNGGTAVMSLLTFQTAGNTSDTDAGAVSLFSIYTAQIITADFGESLICNSALSDADLNTLGSYLAARWGLTWTTVS